MTALATPSYADTLAQLNKRAGVTGGPVTLVSLTLAGVQDFIAAARTTRDVWNGSYLLSYLSFRMTTHAAKAAEKLAKGTDPWRDGGVVLLPDVEGQPFVSHARGENVPDAALGIASFPNSVLLAVPAVEEPAARIAEDAVRHAREAWTEVARACRTALVRKAGTLPAWVERQWDEQTRGARVLEVYWSTCAVPASAAAFFDLQLAGGFDADDPYALLLHAAGRRLGARKLVRTLDQVGEEGYRCSLCGTRAALAGYETGRPRPAAFGTHTSLTAPVVKLDDYRAFWNRLRAAWPPWFRPQERLCAVCVVRRLAPECFFARNLPGLSPDFPSTSTIAIAGSLARAAASVAGQPARQRFQEALAAVGKEVAAACPRQDRWQAGRCSLDGLTSLGTPDIDGQWYYPDTYEPKSLARELGIEESIAERRFDLGRGGAAPARKAARTLKSFLAARHVRLSNYYGVLVADADEMGKWITGRRKASRSPFTPKDQRRLSRSITECSEAWRRAVEEEFPGRAIYSGGDDLLAFVPATYVLPAMMRLRDEFLRRLDPGCTVSLACVLARHNDPLSSAIALAHEHLKHTAKEQFGRNAWAIVRTTAGAPAGLGNRALEKVQEMVELMHEYVATQGKLGLSDTTVAAFSEAAVAMERTAPDPDRDDTWDHLAKAAGRRYAGKEADADDLALKLVVLGCVCRDWCAGRKEADVYPLDPYRLFVNVLGLCRFLSREG